ncbi:MAG: ATP-binding protein [Lactobacillus crispatus]|jgi:predicted AAA+ superfamily ATPase|uniref:ATP-binding protein n=1 Tax=Lactobacillus crispatus TaxID=47770 RepID=UPI0018A898CE|nr:ATP-binding protein [Lactobacillus crispatus]MCH4003770.1 ATP-binding protein [Lactobacillus crispatus]MCI1334870.1 ATP-binding protein [Lactobacillus crispatus]MCI1365251.1 ATP-binding protein [Lactobacillus crispatus]MCI1493244.1 ATP-binding protein [Lactobacillus crispatus]MCI1523783.1 ATP-binding protein [Lactobacillus crispatus]
MNHQVIRHIIAEQHRVIKNAVIFPRDYEFDTNANYVLVGLRRAGKSTLLYKVARDLVKKGVDWSQIIYINFEDERLNGFKLTDFDDILAVAGEMTDKEPFIFLDEVQNIEGWEKFARRLADQKYRVYITGSNAKMLEWKIVERLGARYFIKTIYPYDFNEFLTAKGIDHTSDEMFDTFLSGKIRRGAADYLSHGGLPETLIYSDQRDYLESIYQKILFGDIIARNDVRNSTAFKLLINKIAETIMHDVSYRNLAKSVASVLNTKISTETVINYISYANSAFLLFEIKNYVSKFTDKNTTPKYYFIDNGILNLFLLNKPSILLENMVAIALYEKYHDQVFYLKSSRTKVDIDFYLPSQKTAIQVAFSINESSYEREIGNLLRLAKVDNSVEHFIIVTGEEEKHIEEDGVSIETIPLYKFLLGDLVRPSED